MKHGVRVTNGLFLVRTNSHVSVRSRNAFLKTKSDESITRGPPFSKKHFSSARLHVNSFWPEKGRSWRAHHVSSSEEKMVRNSCGSCFGGDLRSSSQSGSTHTMPQFCNLMKFPCFFRSRSSREIFQRVVAHLKGIDVVVLKMWMILVGGRFFKRRRLLFQKKDFCYVSQKTGYWASRHSSFFKLFIVAKPVSQCTYPPSFVFSIFFIIWYLFPNLRGSQAGTCFQKKNIEMSKLGG